MKVSPDGYELADLAEANEFDEMNLSVPANVRFSGWTGFLTAAAH